MLDRTEIARALVLDDTKHAITAMVGAELTESNLRNIEANMRSALRQETGGEPAPRPDLTVRERQRYAALQKVLKSSMWNSRSALANRMRHKHPDAKMKHITEDERAKRIHQFASDEILALQVFSSSKILA